MRILLVVAVLVLVAVVFYRRENREAPERTAATPTAVLIDGPAGQPRAAQ